MLQRNIFDDEDAVSEVVGTILILSITVVLFSSIFATVSYLDTPDRKTYIDMEAEFQRDDYNLSISHQGGRSLDMIDTSFYIVIGGDSIRYEGGDVELDGDDDTWDMNEDVVIDLDGFDWEDIEAQGIPIAEVMVSDNANNHLVWSTEVSLSEAVYRPRLRDVGVYYEPEWKDHVEKGDEVELYARVSHPNESASNLDVTVDLSDLNDYNGIEEMEYDGNTMGSEFNKEINITSDEEERTYGLEVIVEDSNGHFAKDYIKLNVGPQGDVRERPDIIVDENKIEFNPTSPTSGRSLRVDAVIENDGGSAARVNVTIKDSHPKGGKHVTNISDIRVAAGGGHDISATWDVIGSGTHNISINVTAVESPGGDNYRDLDEVIAYKGVSVKPSILVIDDVPSSTIEASIMKNALGGTDFSYDFYNVSGPEADGPSDETIEGHDLLIWLTGGAEENTLTQNDIDNLKEYLDEGNNLWLIGEHVLEDVQNIDTSFRDNYLGINGFDDEEGAPNEDYAEGVGILENLSLPTSDNFAEADGGYITTGDADPMMEDGEGGDNIGSSFEGDEGFRSAAHSVQLRSIQSGRTNIAYRVIKWLANMESVSGSDVAISEQSFSTRTPMYQEEVEVTATVRNNGPQNETVDVRLYVNDRLDTSQRETVTLTRDGGEQDVTFTWTAEPIGSHDLVVKADPFNRIEDETNFKNNDITYTDFDTNINVQYSVLIVDATHADGAANETEFAEDQIDSLGYAYDYFEIEDGDRPSEELMSKYNSVKWIVGNTSYDEDNNQYPLSDEDIENIQDYLDDNTFVSFYLEGHRIIKDLVNEGGAIKTGFITNYLGIDYNEINILEQVPEELHGVTDETLSGDNYTHGINYLIDSEREDFYGFETTDQGIPIFTDQDGNTVGARYHNEEDEYRTAFSGVGLPHIAGPNVEEEWYEDFNGPVNTSAGAAREEYTYLLTKWFGNEDERVELRVSDVDIEIDDDHPTLGRSYLLTASVQNVGFKDSGALVRFKDEDNLIASDSIHVSADGSHTAEVSWRPSFAGMRSLRVLVDPLQNVAEIGNDPDDPNDIDTMGFNNHATIDRRVYYFWDDMEDGDDKWDHEATLANINGEQPLEYLSNEYEEVYTDVASEWDEDMSHNVSMTDQFSHSDPNSHWMAEPMAVNDTVQEEVPVDVVMAIDTSGSMHWDDEGYDVGSDDPESRMYQAVGAAIGFIEDMNEEDKLEVWTFHPEGGYDPDPYQYLPFAEMNDGNKQDFIDALNDIRYQDGDWPDGPNGNTPYYDTLGHAIQSASEINEGEDNDRLEFVIGLADGEDNTGDEYDQTGEWGEGGLLNAPPMVYNIGFVGENLHPDDSTYPLAPYWDDNHDGNPVIEEEMFHVGNSTPSDEWQNKYGNRTDDDDYGPGEEGDPYTGRYYFAEQAEDVGTVFEEVRNIITQIASEKAEEGEVTSVPSPDKDGTESSSSENELNSEPGLMQDILYEEDFSGMSNNKPPDDWTRDPDDHWLVGNSNNAGGDRPELRFEGGVFESDTFRCYTPAIDTSGYSDLELSFKHYLDHDSWWSIDLLVQTSTDGNNWDMIWDTTTSSDVGPTTETVDFTENAGSDTLYISWTFSGQRNRINNWYIDDIILTDEGAATNPPDDPSPQDGATSISTDPELSVYVSHPDGDTMDVTFYDASDDSEIGTNSGVSSDTRTPGVTWSGLDYETTYEWYAVADDGSESTTSSTWSFTTHAEGEDPVDPDPELPTGANENKTAVTPAFDLTEYDTATLSFMQKYRMVSGTNGGFVMIGWEDDNGEQVWRYVDKPSQRMYNGNLNLSVYREDDFDNEITYCYNGVSGGGTFGWEHVRINIMNYLEEEEVPDEYRDSVRVKFNYTQYGSGTGYGWYLDDVRVTASRAGELNNDGDPADMWDLVETTGHDGEDTTAWRNMDPETGELKGGIDNGLMTNSIDLTNARTVSLNAYFKFNINEQSGIPPDGFRVEITTDGGVTWMPVNVGVRTGYGVSGTGGEDSNSGADAGNGWTTADSLSRLETDLSDFSGNVVRLRFRVVTTNADDYEHVEDPNEDAGFYIDEVSLSGSSTVED